MSWPRSVSVGAYRTGKDQVRGSPALRKFGPTYDRWGSWTVMQKALADSPLTLQYSPSSRTCWLVGPVAMSGPSAPQQIACQLGGLPNLHAPRHSDCKGRTATGLACDRNIAAHHLTEPPAYNEA